MAVPSDMTLCFPEHHLSRQRVDATQCNRFVRSQSALLYVNFCWARFALSPCKPGAVQDRTFLDNLPESALPLYPLPHCTSHLERFLKASDGFAVGRCAACRLCLDQWRNPKCRGWTLVNRATGPYLCSCAPQRVFQRTR